MSSKVKLNPEKIIASLQQAVNDENFTDAWLLAIDILEFIIKKTNTKVDDVIFLPILVLLKNRFKIKK